MAQTDKRLKAQIEQAADMIRDSKKAVAFTGAGLSVASGIPDFRSPGGLWSKFDPLEVASIQALRTNPRGVWEFLLDAVTTFGRAEPNPAHYALADLEAKGKLDAIITQNIDSLHQRAGSKHVIEYHGGCDHFYCMKCKKRFDPSEAFKLTPQTIPWSCDECGGLVRPNVVFFGEGIPEEAVRGTNQALAGADLAVVAGSSGTVAPANAIPAQVKARGGKVIEINLGETEFGRVTDLRFDAPVEKILPEIVKTLG